MRCSAPVDSPAAARADPDPATQPGDAVIAVKAAAVNPSDLADVAGHMEGTTLPRVPGRDFSGVVLAGPQDWIGARSGAPAETSAGYVTARMRNCWPFQQR